ncbi:hypothetical protein, partial [Tahibacter caeni]|uniref:hypothetical protein n=1 Tax=Tahibacter caeni TaxID=1453545 RepID=UPI00214943A2
ALRSASAWLAAIDDGGFLTGASAWLLSPAGLPIVAALALTLYRQLRGAAAATRAGDAAPS